MAKQIEADTRGTIDIDAARVAELGLLRDSRRTKIERIEEQISKCRRDIEAIAKSMQGIEKDLDTIEILLERKKGEKHAILMYCKVSKKRTQNKLKKNNNFIIIIVTVFYVISVL